MKPDRVLPGPNRRVQLMATCLCDAFYADVAQAAVEILEYLGCTIEFPEGQTCCGQPAFNGGDWPASRKVVRHTVRTFSGSSPILVPSASCAAMLMHGTRLEFEKEADRLEVETLGRRTWELADFIVSALGVSVWPGRYEAVVAFHRSCHSRGTGSSAAATALISSIEGITVVPVGEDEQCCGFGGTFSVTFPHISSAMGALKLEHLRTANPQELVSTDMSCLMHLNGLAEKTHRPLRTRHFVQVLRDALKHGGLL